MIGIGAEYVSNNYATLEDMQQTKRNYLKNLKRSKFDKSIDRKSLIKNIDAVSIHIDRTKNPPFLNRMIAKIKHLIRK